AAQRHVDDLGAHLHGGVDALGDGEQRPRAVLGGVVAQHLDGQDAGVPPDPGHAFGVVGDGGDDPGHVGAVVAHGAGVGVGELGPDDDLARQVRVGVVHAAVE